MCTVTVVSPDGRGGPRVGQSGRPLPRLRVVCNRDESRSRAEALPSTIVPVGGRWAAMPIDPVSIGTWIGVSDAGLVMCLLNRTLPTGPADAASGRSVGLRSRGEIVPGLLHADNIESALAAAERLDATRYPTFRVLLAQAGRTVVLASDGTRLTVQVDERGCGPVMATSSGLGDHLVEGVRRDLFRSAFDASPDVCATQDLFHAHRWEDRPHLSVLMARADARTVSRTVVEIGDGAATMETSAVDESTMSLARTSRVSLPLAASGVER